MKRFLTLFMALLCSVTTLAIAPSQTERNPQTEYTEQFPVKNKTTSETHGIQAVEIPSVQSLKDTAQSEQTITKEDTNVNAQFSSKQIAQSKPANTQKAPNNTNSTAQEPSQTEPTTSSGTKQLIATITHYCACKKCNGKYSYTDSDGAVYCSTAGGVKLYNGRNNGNYCAANFGKIGNKVTIKGVTYTIVDRFGNNSGSPKIDIFVSDGHSACMQKGRQTGVSVILH